MAEPTIASSGESSTILTTLKVWNYLKDDKNKSAYDYSSLPSGSATIYSKCIKVSHQYGSDGEETAFYPFERVLTTFVGENNQPLINYFNPGP